MDAEPSAEDPNDRPAAHSGLAAADVERLEREERAATVRLSSIEAGRRKGGLAGAAIAGAMLTLHEIYEGPLREIDIEEVSESSDDHGDIDVDGIDVSVGDVNVWAPPPADPRAGPASDGS